MTTKLGGFSAAQVFEVRPKARWIAMMQHAYLVIITDSILHWVIVSYVHRPEYQITVSGFILCELFPIAILPEPVHARFTWHRHSLHNLDNKEKLPAVPFRTDDIDLPK